VLQVFDAKVLFLKSVLLNNPIFFRCDHCEKTFKSLAGLKQHDKNCPPELKPKSEIQTIMFVNKDGVEQCIQLEDGQVYSEGIYEIQETANGETHVTFIDNC